MITKLVQKFGNSGHVILPKDCVGKRIRFIAEPKTFDDIKSEILEMLNPYLENVLGIYLYGSYSRNEQNIESDVDILVITDTKLKIIDKIDDFSIISVTICGIENTLRANAVLVLPIIKEAKTIINPELLARYRDCKFTRSNTKNFIESSERILELNKNGIELDFEIGSLIYSLMLRLRGLLMIKLMLNYKFYSKSQLFDYLENNGFSMNKIEELYKIYSKERNNIKVKDSSIVNKEDISKLLSTADRLLQEVKKLLK